MLFKFNEDFFFVFLSEWLPHELPSDRRTFRSVF